MTDISFEFFPPRSERMAQQFWRALAALEGFRPRFISLTDGAGGSTRTRAHDLLRALSEQKRHQIAAHLTCVGASREETDATIAAWQGLGIGHFVALRGDMPNGAAPFTPHPQGYSGSVALVEALAQRGVGEISVSAYPERHPDAADAHSDMDILKRKWQAGACRAITQFCFDTAALLRLRDQLACAGMEIALVPGIMPTTNFDGVVRMAKRCGAAVPRWLRQRYEGLGEDVAARREIAADIGAEQCRALVEAGFAHLHFYTLNQSAVVARICALCRLGGKAA